MALTVRSLAEDEAAQELARKILLRAPGLRCTACGHRDFAIIDQPMAHARTMLWRYMERGPATDVTDTASAQPLVSLICTNCGHVEQFADSILNGTTPDAFGEVVILE